MNIASDNLHRTDADDSDTAVGEDESNATAVEEAPNSIVPDDDGGQNETEIDKNLRKDDSLGSKYKLKMFVQYSRECLCVLALILTTLATLQNRTPKVVRHPVPPPIFDTDASSFIQEWPNGNLNTVQNRVASSELSLIYFYAPWCAESLFAKQFYAEIAQFYHKEIYFAAVNCWHPDGECRLYYSKVQKWPVLMAYLPRGLAVQYNGDWSFWSMSRFIDGLQRPLQRVHSQRDLLKTRINNDVVVLGIYETVQSSRKYQTYYQAAVKWLEVDPLQNVKFSVYTGGHTEAFNVTEAPVLRIFSSMGMQEYNETKWSVDSIQSWVQRISIRKSTWITLPQTKSSVLSGYFSKNPSFILFSPRSAINADNNKFLMVKETALKYQNCRNKSDDGLLKHIPEVRRENLNKMKQLYTFCLKHIPKREPPSSCILEHSKTTMQPSNATFQDKIKPKVSSEFCEATKVPIAVHPTFIDYRTPQAILKTLIGKECQKLHRLDKSEIVSLLQTSSESQETEDLKIVDCNQNRSLSFNMLDSNLYHDYLSKFTTSRTTFPTALIIDNENENTFEMEKPMNQANLISFVQDFLRSSLNRTMRSLDIPSYPVDSSDGVKRVYIEEINAQRFDEVTHSRNKTIVVLFYTPQCAFCNIMSQTILDLAKTMTSIDINFFRIDGERNALRWEYSMERFPTLLIFPKNKTAETRVFPLSMEVSRKNVLGFLLANMDRRDQFRALVQSCMLIRMNIPFLNCVKHLRRKISDEIANHLDAWLRLTAHRSRIFNSLGILKDTYDSLLRARSVCDLELVLKHISGVSYSNEFEIQAK